LLAAEVVVEAPLPVEPELFVDDVEVWVPEEPQLVVEDVDVEFCEPVESELFDEEVCVDVDPDPP
jgi:hypothetical protein